MELQLKNDKIITYTAVKYGHSETTGIYGIAEALNHMSAEDAEMVSLEAVISYPSDRKKTRIYPMDKCMKKFCKEAGVVLTKVKLRENPLLREVEISVMAVGVTRRRSKAVYPGQEILLMNQIGTEGMLRIAEEKRSELSKRFSQEFLRQIEAQGAVIFAQSEIKAAIHMGVPVVRQIGEGGIFAELYRVTEEFGVGLDVDMKQISVMQETIEVCEHFRLNPYQMTSTGGCLLFAENGQEIAEKLANRKIKVTVIGRTTDQKDKVIRNGEDFRYLDRPALDEIYTLISTNR